MNTPPTPRDRAEWLLRIHKGACFVIDGNELQPPFREMANGGIVTISTTLIPVRGINICKKGFRVVYVDEVEPQAH